VTILSNGKKNHSLKTLIKLGNNSTASAILLFRKVSDPKRHGVPTLEKISKERYLVKNVIEKPSKPKSNFGLLPIYLFTPRIFEKLKQIVPGKGNEYQLTDAIQKLVDDFCTVTEEAIVEAVRFLFHEVKIVVEPSGALGIAALLSSAVPAAGRIGVIVSGGNIDGETIAAILNT